MGKLSSNLKKMSESVKSKIASLLRSNDEVNPVMKSPISYESFSSEFQIINHGSNPPTDKSSDSDFSEVTARLLAINSLSTHVTLNQMLEEYQIRFLGDQSE